jgi:hypothetical protein
MLELLVQEILSVLSDYVKLLDDEGDQTLHVLVDLQMVFVIQEDEKILQIVFLIVLLQGVVV